ncbi:MAG: coproporphyrinogen dehydrogenase HemZ [Clostridia bacterium]|nr:coproporphyrinogen dehydrogenase HemZ [Clostridia bacterium]
MSAVSLYTNAPALTGDMAEVIRLFLGNIALLINEAGGDFSLTHTETESDGLRVVTVTDGEISHETREKLTGDAVIDKRLRRRQAKLGVYQVMKARTGMTPPWGSLTGIRPTRLLYANLDQGMEMDAACAELRRIFDVSAEKTDILRRIVTVQREMTLPQSDEADVYIGIPFCVTRCAYCSFLSGEVGKGELLAPYTDALCAEIDAAKALLRQTGLRPRAFYMGGGTPTALPPELLRRILNAASPILAGCREITVEAGRPDTIDREKLQVLLDAGVTRISVNPQTMHDETLQRIGRRHSAAQTETAYRLAREMGFGHINMDLIAGLPGEDLRMFRQTLAWLKALAPESMTVHTLSIKRSSLLHLWQAQLPDGDMVADMVRAGAEAAQEMGMRPYYLYRQKYMAGNQENVGYALPGHECAYNVDMMEETANVIALGAGAASKRLFPEKGFIRRAFNVSDIRQYIDRVQEMAERKRELFLNEPAQR